MLAAAVAPTLVALLAAAQGAKKDYAGFRLLRTEPLRQGMARALEAEAASARWDFWQWPRDGANATIFACPHDAGKVESALRRLGIPYNVLVKDMSKVLAEAENVTPPPRPNTNSISFDKFNNFPEICTYLDTLKEKYSHLVKVMSAGKSYQGRDLKVVKISSPKGDSNKRAIFIDATMHAREWITTAAALYIINQLVEHYEVNKQLVDSMDWYVMPVLNPDGYEFTFTNERFWWKTLSKNGHPKCLGVDLDFNFRDHWNGSGGGGGGSGRGAPQCARAYPGPSPASEPETRALQGFLREVGPQLDLYLSLHSRAGQQRILHPWSNTNKPPRNADELVKLGREVGRAMQAVRGTRYAVGNYATAMHVACGTSLDWVTSTAGVNCSYVVVLPPGGVGYNHPPADILPIAAEAFRGVCRFARHFASRQSPTHDSPSRPSAPLRGDFCGVGK